MTLADDKRQEATLPIRLSYYALKCRTHIFLRADKASSMLA